MTVACARTGIAALVLALIARGALREITALTSRQKAGVALVGALLAAHFALFLAGLAATSLAAAVSLVSLVSLVALEPIALVVAALVAFRLRPTGRETIGLLVATAGACVVGDRSVRGSIASRGTCSSSGASVP